MVVARTRRQFIQGSVLALVGGALVQAREGRSAPMEEKGMKDIRFVVFHVPGPAWEAGKTLLEQPGVMEHVGHYRKLLEAGKLALGGPHLDERGGGMMVPAAGVLQDEITAFAAEDPAVKSGLLRFEVRPWLIGMSA